MRIKVDLSCPEHSSISRVPRALFKLYYFGGDDLLSLIKYSGCPHSGCEHKLIIYGDSLPEVIAWLDLFIERYPETSEDIEDLKSDIRCKVLHSSGKNVRVSLKDIKRFEFWAGPGIIDC